jgi:hypothetical protein
MSVEPSSPVRTRMHVAVVLFDIEGPTVWTDRSPQTVSLPIEKEKMISFCGLQKEGRCGG